MFDLIQHLREQYAWSVRTFGRGYDPEAIIDHIAGEGGELDEVSGDPSDLEEWVDVLFLGFDGAMRSGHTPREVCAALEAKLATNEAREWPEPEDQEPGKRVEHIES